MNDADLLERRLTTIQRIVANCENTGKTKIQKISYFLQESLDVPLKYPFRIHYYGPYSDQLDNVLSLAHSMGRIEIEPDPDWFGYHVTSTERPTSSQHEEDGQSKDIQPEPIDSVIRRLGSLETYELELYATIHFIGRPERGTSKEETVSTVCKLKPKFTENKISHAYDVLKRGNLI